VSKAPDRVGVQLGYRCWVLGPFGNLLPPYRIWYGDKLWSKPWNLSGPEQARCPMGHEPPVWFCECGIHAYYEPAHARSAFYGTPVVKLYGAALFWGDIIHHTTYFRAEYALPLAFTTPSGAVWRGRERGIPVKAESYDTEITRAGNRLQKTTGAPVGLSWDDLETYAIKEAARYGWARETSS
jgi:hypothetical protein